MIKPWHTDVVLAAVVVLLIAWEVTALVWGHEATISERVWHYSRSAFGYVMILLVGILLGHFFWQRRDRDSK